MRFLDYFDNFLRSKRKYKENQAFWRLAIAIWCDESFEEMEADSAGNPILYIIFPRQKKSLRIIQLNKEVEEKVFSAYVQKKEFDTFICTELVISLQLNKETYQDTEKLFKQFLNKNLENEKISAINAKYQVIW